MDWQGITGASASATEATAASLRYGLKLCWESVRKVVSRTKMFMGLLDSISSSVGSDA